MFDYIDNFFWELNPNSENEKNEIIGQSEKIIIQKNDSFIKIECLYECTLEEFNNFIDEYIKLNNDLNIPLKMFYMANENILKSKLKKQEIYIIKNENYLYYISKSDKNIKISEQKTENNEINETILSITDDKFSVSKYIHDLNHSTKVTKWYPCVDTLKVFALDKKEAMSLIQNLLDNINLIYKSKNINKILNILKLCDKTNLVLSENYHPIINDDIITLSWRYKPNNSDINSIKSGNFDIILNETREIIGGMCFDYNFLSGFTYSGNVSYDIKEQYRNNHYATRALKLLKEVLYQNKFTGDKDLYIATIPNNIYSQKVAINNDAVQIYTGEVPKDDMLYTVEGIKEVNVYRIRMK